MSRIRDDVADEDLELNPLLSPLRGQSRSGSASVPAILHKVADALSSNPRKSLVLVVLIVVGIISIAVSGTGSSNNTKNHNPHRPAHFDALELGVLSSMDESVDPCVDFYTFACGKYVSSNRIPDDKPSISRTFTSISDQNLAALRDIAQSSSHNDVDGDKVGQLYHSCMNLTDIEFKGLSPLEAFISDVWREKQTPVSLIDVAEIAGRLLAHDIGVLFDVGVEVDAKLTTVYRLTIGQGGLVLPGVEYYDDSALLQKYENHLRFMMKGAFPQDKRLSNHTIVKQIVNFEQSIAKFTRKPDELRDPEKTYHVFTVSKLQQLSAGFPLDILLSNAGLSGLVSAPKLTRVVVSVPKFVTSMASLLNSTDLTVIELAMKWRVLHSFSTYLPKQFQDSTFEFFSHTLYGIKTQKPRWKTCVSVLDQYVGDLLGKKFVNRTFSEASKDTVIEMIWLLKNSLSSTLQDIKWIDDGTQEAAVDKLNSILALVGYPDPGEWIDYSGLNLNGSSALSNIALARKFMWNLDVSYLDKPVDKKKWQMTPPTVNAYYDPTFNSINFPSGILQPPFFNITYPSAMNFGSIGSVIGHELVHAFDDSGAKFDKNGTLRNWWSSASLSEFHNRAQCVVEQYENYKVQGLKINGNLTLGENIADNGGLHAAYLSWQDFSSSKPHSPPLMHAYTDAQLFFISFAQTWCGISRPDYEKLLLQVDPHSPKQWRVNGVVANSDDFVSAFKEKCHNKEPRRSACKLFW